MSSNILFFLFGSFCNLCQETSTVLVRVYILIEEREQGKEGRRDRETEAERQRITVFVATYPVVPRKAFKKSSKYLCFSKSSALPHSRILKTIFNNYEVNMKYTSLDI